MTGEFREISPFAYLQCAADNANLKGFALVDVEAIRKALSEQESVAADLGCAKQQLRDLIRRSSALMTALETHGAIIVPHLLDTDDNPGQFLREQIETANAFLGAAQ